MSFVYDSDNVKDNEKRKFQPDNSGDVAVNVKSNDVLQVLFQILDAINSLSDGVNVVKTDIPSGNTAQIDLNLFSGFSRVEYIFSIKDKSTLETKGFRLSAQNNNGNLSDSINSILGENLAVQVNVISSLTEMILQVQNNQPNEIEVSFIKKKI